MYKTMKGYWEQKEKKDQATKQGLLIPILCDIQIKILKFRKALSDVLHTLKDYRCQTRLLYSENY